MQWSATGSTDVGQMVLFWPEVLPAEFEERFETEPAELVDKLHAAGQLLLFPGDAKGDYSLVVFLDETISEELLNYATLAGKVERLQAAGECWFGGIECLFRSDRDYAERHPRKCSAIAILAGEYSAEVFSTEIPADVYEQWIRERAGASAQRWWWIQTWFAATGVVAAMVTLGGLFFGSREFTVGAFVSSAALLCIGWLLSLTPGYELVQQARREYAARYPDLIVRLRSIAESL